MAGVLSESRARGILLRHAARPGALAAVVRDRGFLEYAAFLERWIARREWLEVGGGWVVDASLDGYRFLVQREPWGRPALRIVAGHVLQPRWQAAWWVDSPALEEEEARGGPAPAPAPADR